MKFMLERETVVRSLKHIINNFIRDCESDELIASLISHIFNCLFAPKDFLKRLDDGTIKFGGNTLADLAKGNLHQNGLDLENEKNVVTKKDKKKMNLKRKSIPNLNEGTEEEKKVEQKDTKKDGKSCIDMSDLLFKSQFEDVVFDSALMF